VGLQLASLSRRGGSAIVLIEAYGFPSVLAEIPDLPGGVGPADPCRLRDNKSQRGNKSPMVPTSCSGPQGLQRRGVAIPPH